MAGGDHLDIWRKALTVRKRRKREIMLLAASAQLIREEWAAKAVAEAERVNELRGKKKRKRSAQ